MKRTVLIAVIMVVALFGVVVYANAAAVGPKSMEVRANVKAKVELTVPTFVNLTTDVAPGEPALGSALVEYNSNKNATLTAGSTPSGFDTLTSDATLAGATGLHADRGGNKEITDNITGTVDWDALGDSPVTGYIEYTLTQDL